ncbi:glycosyltransferase family 2 protein [Mesoflavibacter sp. SCSIO 43206]|uniref:glycosyltransferase family 2 protein n=1 Tax=Mesoflavibacter sp. SCSIO 43206 TaxID=2779362 RepID=UPI001CA7FD3E|nr:glycosyltransferase family 2 protein [Mesoflavibacter sp. SCSIO 43206]UAB76396.1 glycosyltransferase family 2 protein [Mesoflavibacter sp. SCSIO 43206]
MQPLVSIITPMYNSEKFILKTINSVVDQTYSNWELLLIDDGSTDNTIQIVEGFKQKYSNIKLLQNSKNLGAAQSRNKGIIEAKGDYIAFLDADDLWKPNKLDLQIQFMQTHNCDVSFSSYEQIDENGKPLNKLVQAIPKLTYNKYIKTNYIGNLTGMYNAKTLGKITSPDLRKRQDWLLWLAAIKKSSKPALGIQESLAYYRVRQNSMSSNKIELLKYNYLVYKKGLGFSTLKSLYRMLIFLWEQFMVKSKLIVSTEKK